MRLTALLCVTLLIVAIAPGAPTAEQPPAKVLFGKAAAPAPLAARSIGSYARGCLAGGVALPVDGPGKRERSPSW